MTQNDTYTSEHTFCRICESLCGLEVIKEGNEIVEIRPNPNHVATAGFACPKGLKQHHMYNSPDRLLHPMQKVNGQWQEVSWDVAYKGIGEKIKSIIRKYSKDSVAMYVGTAAGFSVLHPIFAQGFMDGIGSKNMYASASQDCSNKFAVAERMYGHPFVQPFPDLHHTNCLIIIGANPIVSKWSFLQVPNPSKHIKDISRRGGQVIVVDPRRTETAKIADQHIFIRPNSDPYFYLSFLNELHIQNGIDKERYELSKEDADHVLTIAAEWPAEKTEALTGINSEVLKALVATYIRADGAALYSSTGVNMGSYGSISFWIQECINYLSGNLDRKGGTLVGKGVIDFPAFAKKHGKLLRKDRSRIGDFHSTNDTFPGGILADEILTPGKKQIKALIVTGGNPLITMANSNRLREAFSQLELLVTLDIYPNETGSIGHYMLPCTSPLERPDLPFIFPLMLGLQTKPYLEATRAVVTPKGEQRDEATIYLDLCKAAGVSLFDSMVAQKLLEALKWLYSRKRVKSGRQPSLPQEGILNFLLRITGQPGFKKLLKYPNGRPRQNHESDSFLRERLLTEDRLVNLAPQMMLDNCGFLEAHFNKEMASRDQFKLITRRAVTTHNSWTHNISEFVKGDRYTNYLYMHSEDMAELEIEQKDMVDVSTPTGTVRLPVKHHDELMQGTVALPHGWGHQSSLMQVAKATSGVNVNILAADGPEAIEKISGMAHLTGFDVTITRSKGEKADSWSGLEKDVMVISK